MSKTSVDLDRRCDSLDAMMAGGFDVTADTGQSTETQHGDEMDAGAVVLRKLYEINAEKPLAVNVLLDAAVGRLSEDKTAAHLKTNYRKIRRLRSWLRKEHPDMAACMPSGD